MACESGGLARGHRCNVCAKVRRVNPARGAPAGSRASARSIMDGSFHGPHRHGAKGNPSSSVSLPAAFLTSGNLSMRATYLIPVLLLSLFAFSLASAAPAASLQGYSVHSPVILAQYRPYSHRSSHHSSRYSHHSHYVAGHRYRSAPHGWHRYHRRPGNWHTRGCVLVGPVWFCP